MARRALTVLALAFSLVAVTGVAWAAWSTTGSGTLGARAVTPVVLTVTDVPQAASLYPRVGASYSPAGPGTLVFQVTNPNPYPVSLTTITVSNGTASNTTACPAGNVLAATPTIDRTATPITLAGGATSPNITLASAVYMIGAAPIGCAGLTFSVTVALSGTSA